MDNFNSKPTLSQVQDDSNVPMKKSDMGGLNVANIMPKTKAVPDVSLVSNDAFSNSGKVTPLYDDSKDSQRGMGYGDAKTGLKGSPTKL